MSTAQVVCLQGRKPEEPGRVSKMALCSARFVLCSLLYLRLGLVRPHLRQLMAYKYTMLHSTGLYSRFLYLDGVFNSWSWHLAPTWLADDKSDISIMLLFLMTNMMYALCSEKSTHSCPPSQTIHQSHIQRFHNDVLLLRKGPQHHVHLHSINITNSASSFSTKHPP